MSCLEILELFTFWTEIVFYDTLKYLLVSCNFKALLSNTVVHNRSIKMSPLFMHLNY